MSATMTKDTQESSDNSSEAGPPTLVNIALDLQILICTLLHPSDILALRETCKPLQLPTRQRVVWVAALRRICLDNSLFLPSFPIVDMSDAELERAAMAPRRWIELNDTFGKQHPNDSGSTLHPRTTRIIEDPLATARPHLFIVPGGRYMVSWSRHGIFVWDLGYTSSADCKLIASIGVEDGRTHSCKVQATPDGMGLIIFSLTHQFRQFSVYEIYPQSETPQLTRIAHLASDSRAYLLPASDRVIWYRFYQNMIIFIVWDYRMNYSIKFSVDVDLQKFTYNIKVIATKTAIIVLCAEEMLVFAIPPLSPQPPDFFDDNSIYMSSLFRIAFSDFIGSHAEHVAWQMISPWYFGSSQPLYFDILCRDSKLHRFEIIVKPDISDTSLLLINTQVIPHDLNNSIFSEYSICEDTLVACWEEDFRLFVFGVYTTGSISQGSLAAKVLLPRTVDRYRFSLCPASGRYVGIRDDTCRIIVVDLF